MIAENVHIETEVTGFNFEQVQKGLWMVVLHAQRVPPHIGLMLNGNYNSLTIKGQELDISFEALHRTIVQKNIASIFIKISAQPVFSFDHQLEMFREDLKKFEFVKQGEATCLSPVKLFFKHFYAICSEESELFFDFVQHLKDNQYIESACALNMELKNGITLPHYTVGELNEKIKNERKPYYND